MRPRRFDSAQEIADKFKEGLPVIMNLEATDREVSRRLIDFASGLCYGLNGSMEKVATRRVPAEAAPRRRRLRRLTGRVQRRFGVWGSSEPTLACSTLTSTNISCGSSGPLKNAPGS